jgi:hypothetical protein
MKSFTRKRKHPLKIAIVAMFKNESMGIREWVKHYKWQGVDHIVLLDNNSTDAWREQLRGYESFVTVIPAPEPHAQSKHYNTIALPWLKEHKYDVVGVVDLDEYAFGLPGLTLKGHLEQLFAVKPRPSQLLLKFHMFGSSGLIRQPKSIRKAFTWKKREVMRHNTKAFLWVQDIIRIGVHRSRVRGDTIIAPPGLQLNHYVIQSREFFKKVKMTRGDAVKGEWDTARDWKYFRRFDTNEVNDTLLKTMVEGDCHNLF